MDICKLIDLYMQTVIIHIARFNNIMLTKVLIDYNKSFVT